MNNKIPPPIVTLFCGLGIYCSSYLFPTFSFDYSILISIIFVLIGFFIFLSAIRLFKKHETTVDPSKPEKASSLITNGVFKYSRNPMYLGMLLLLCSISIQFSLVGGLIIIPIFVLFITKYQIIPEEKAMAILFKEDFQSYKEKTRRWFWLWEMSLVALQNSN